MISYPALFQVLLIISLAIIVYVFAIVSLGLDRDHGDENHEKRNGFFGSFHIPVDSIDAFMHEFRTRTLRKMRTYLMKVTNAVTKALEKEEDEFGDLSKK